ncbi:SRPBCC family protein [Paenibacillus cymbidii]|uniref:SRPBCC family protein n=1 Tax=Paenibacillus cymbidii TaxID=1639034 RepID=UPI001081E02E|nr:SRPBCC family protein [Paenibacillus cymbidii]
MTESASNKRTDTASRVMQASPETVYRAFIDPEALVLWLPPDGMKGRIDAFDARPGGTYRMTLTFLAPDHNTPGKTTAHEDVVEGRFLQFVPNERIVQAVTFESDDARFAGEMVMTWRLEACPEGTRVTIVCENVPEGIGKEDHDAGLSSTLANLARFVHNR